MKGGRQGNWDPDLGLAILAATPVSTAHPAGHSQLHGCLPATGGADGKESATKSEDATDASTAGMGSVTSRFPTSRAANRRF